MARIGAKNFKFLLTSSTVQIFISNAKLKYDWFNGQQFDKLEYTEKIEVYYSEVYKILSLKSVQHTNACKFENIPKYSGPRLKVITVFWPL